MKSIIYLLVPRYLWNNQQEHAISFMMLIAGISIFIGAFSLTLITAIMNGFEQAVYEKMQSIHPDATIYSQNPLNFQAIQHVVAVEFPEIKTISPHAISNVLVHQVKNEVFQPIVATLKGINPKQESAVSTISSKLQSYNTIEQAVHANSIMIGKEMARQLALSLGDSILLLYFDPLQGPQRKITIEQTNALIGGIFETGIDEYDSNVIYCEMSFFETLFPNQGITQIGINFAPCVNKTHIVHRLAKRLSLSIHTWQELYPALVSALVLEKYVMFFILLLITLVACMNIIALIFMLIFYKQGDVIILSYLGMTYAKIQTIFTFIGVSLSICATTFGIIAAWIISILLEKYPFIQLPDAYYVSHLPAKMNFSIAIIVFVIIVGMTLIASWFATRRIRSINISHVLRSGG